MNFGLYLEQILKEKNISKSYFAATLNLSRQTLSTNIIKWKNGRDPNISTIKKYLRSLNLSTKDYFDFM